MPQYQYQCKTRHTITLSHPISECDIKRVCPECGTIMHRVPQALNVNWNGLPPHKADAQSPVVKDFLKSAPERRAQYEKEKENAKT